FAPFVPDIMATTAPAVAAVLVLITVSCLRAGLPPMVSGNSGDKGSANVAAVEPSILTLSAPLSRITLFVLEPVIVRGPRLGLIRSVKLPAPSSDHWFKATVPVSTVRSEVILMVILPLTTLLLIVSKKPPGWDSE